MSSQVPADRLGSKKRKREDMAAPDGQETLESWLDKATDPSNSSERWDCIQRVYEQVNEEQDGPQVATRLLAHKIQSPQEKEALQALTVLEVCMNNCGKQFHKEAGKFRFLNELIKVLSPKYLGKISPEAVRLKVTEVLYGWTQWLKDEVKIQEAYQMLKKQGIVKQDPPLSREIIMPPLSPRATASMFDDADKTKLLEKLLKSQRLDDLQAANLLIKSTVKEEEDRLEKVSRRTSAVEEARSTAKHLRELLEKHRRADLSSEEQEEMKNLFASCDKMRPTLFRLASDTVDDDAALAEILQANDKLIFTVNLYNKEVGSTLANGSGEQPKNMAGVMNSKETKTYHLIDLSALDIAQPDNKPAPVGGLGNNGLSLLDEQLLEFGLSDSPPEMNNVTTQLPQPLRCDELYGLGDITTRTVTASSVLRARGCSGNGGLELKRDFTQGSCTVPSQHGWSVLQPTPALGSTLSQPSIFPESVDNRSLSNVFVPLESIKPSAAAPVTVHDKDGIRVMLHLARDSPPGRPDVIVMVISMLNTSPHAVRDVVFLAAVPKTMTVKLQTSSGTQLPAYNPLLPPTSISQVLLLSNPLKAKVRLRYKLEFLHGEQKTTELGEVDGFHSEILQANDKLIFTVNLYNKEVGSTLANGSGEQPKNMAGVMNSKETKTYHLIDLSALDISQPDNKPAPVGGLGNNGLSLLDEQLLEFGLSDSPPEMNNVTTQLPQPLRCDELYGLGDITTRTVTGSSVLRARGCSGNGGLELKRDFTQGSCTVPSQHGWSVLQPTPALGSTLSQPSIFPESVDNRSLSNVFVPLESIKPSAAAPVTVHDKDGIRVMLHLARDSPPGRPDVIVMVISMLNTSPHAVRDVVFLAAVPKTMTVKLQTSSGTQLPAYNPLLPPTSISQVLLLSNPLKAKVRLRYKLEFLHGEQKTTELGEVDGFH
ncbi:ADP-ribosylation factor-binding protein GGA1-like [Brienomyrus brachyistius]|uniref:ADP-ribosylation factor-binding protein GGA1-like n=1 Tax=Brienomyrus brachyistius TaxID=42636 RepID=UPI0020B454E7|nr:ADP-ribosylation factor-binding protein GGA1-like [Brienomyrus brachyistius]